MKMVSGFLLIYLNFKEGKDSAEIEAPSSSLKKYPKKIDPIFYFLGSQESPTTKKLTQ